jgi:pyruvate dehydrogenase E2 component (dihydrolipoamide acetyltransferase)
MGDLIQQQVVVPPMGDFTDALISEVLIRPGDVVATGQPLIILESDKATVDVPAPMAGVVLEVVVQVGGRVSEGSPILTLVPEFPTAGTEAATPPAPVEDSKSESEGAKAPTAELPRPPPKLVRASPAVRGTARDLGVDLAHVAGTGPGGRVLKSDVHEFLAVVRPSASGLTAEAFQRFGPVEVRPRTHLQRLASQHVSRSWTNIPHVTSFDEADVTELEALRSRVNGDQEAGDLKITLLAFLIRALVPVLKKNPEFNASMIGEDVCIKHHYHIGFATNTPAGLFVPVIRDADKKTARQLGVEIADLAARARGSRLVPAELQGGTFTISSLGGHAGTAFTPIINHPEVAILGVSRSRMAPVWNGSEFAPRLMLPLSLSWDHRVVNGVAAANFLGDFGRLISDPGRMLV